MHGVMAIYDETAFMDGGTRDFKQGVAPNTNVRGWVPTLHILERAILRLSLISEN